MRRTGSGWLAATIAIGGCGGGDARPLRIGVLTSSAGDPVGSASLAVREVEAAGGIASRSIVVEGVTTGQDLPLTASSAARMIDEGVVALVGPQTSAGVLEIADELAAAGVPCVATGATSPALSSSVPPLDHVFRVAASDVFAARLLASVAVDDVGCSAVAIIAQTEVYGQGYGDEVERAVPAFGGTVVAREDVDPNGTDFRAALDRIDAASPDCVFVATYDEPGAFVFNQWYENPTRPAVSWFGSETLIGSPFVDRITDLSYADGMHHVVLAGIPDTDEFDQFRVRFLDAFGVEPNARDVLRYDAMAIVLLALGRTEGRGGAELIDALYEVSRPPGTIVHPGELSVGLAILGSGGDIDYLGASGPVDFDANGDVLSDLLVQHYDATANVIVTDAYVRYSDVPTVP